MTDTDVHDVPEQNCFNCGHRVNAASGVSGDKSPEPGDTLLCVYCAIPGVYDETLHIRPVTSEEMHRLMDDPDFVLAFYATRALVERDAERLT